MAKRKELSEFDRLPKRVQSIISTMRRENWRLCKSLHHKESGQTEVTYHFEPVGRRCGPKSAMVAVEGGFLLPNNDGLFAVTDQTWIAAQ